MHLNLYHINLFWGAILSYTLLVYYLLYPSFNIFLKNKNLRKILTLWELVLLFIGIYAIQTTPAKGVTIYAILGLLYLPIMFILNSSSSRYFFNFRYNFVKWLKSIWSSLNNYLLVLIRTFREELVWRFSFVYLMRDVGFTNNNIILIGSILFYLIHFKKKNKVILLVEFELLLFSFLLYFVYIQTQSVFDVWAIHFLRNSYLDFYKTKKNYA